MYEPILTAIGERMVLSKEIIFVSVV